MKFDFLDNWGLLGAGAGFGFGIFFVPLLYILLTATDGSVSFMSTAYVAVGNAITWGVFGLFAGVFAKGIHQTLNPSQTD